MINKISTASPDLRVKYRPCQFRHLAQGLADPSIRLLTAGLSQRRKLQALLVRAPPGVGKTTLARLLGTRAACQRQELHPYEPCGRCDGCVSVRSDPHNAEWHGYTELDVQGLSPKATIERLMADIPYAKSGGELMPQRVATLDEFHRLSQPDQEKFVKVIEDSGLKYNTLFVLCAAQDGHICPAVAARCCPRPLQLPSLAQATRHLRVIARAEGRRLRHDDAELLVASANCVPRNYLTMLQDVLIIGDAEIHVSHESVVAVCSAASSAPALDL